MDLKLKFMIQPMSYFICFLNLKLPDFRQKQFLKQKVRFLLTHFSILVMHMFSCFTGSILLY